MTTVMAQAGHTDHEDHLIEVEVGPMAHGGHCVARHEGRVVFVRHAIPGERVVVKVTEAGTDASFWRGDVVEVLEASEFRRIHQWKLADALRAHSAGRLPVGGAEYGHIVVPHQRRLKAQVFRDTVQRIAGVHLDPEVIGAPGDEPTGQHWRTRNAFAVNDAGHLAMHAHRSDVLLTVRNMPLGVTRLDELSLWEWDVSGVERVEVATPAGSEASLVLFIPQPSVRRDAQALERLAGRLRRRAKSLPEGASTALLLPGRRVHDAPSLKRLTGRTWLEETVDSERGGRRSFRVTGDGFWQVHRCAPQMLVDAVLEDADVQPGQTVADLYAGAGLFTAYLAQAVGEQGTVYSVEASRQASKDARRNLHDLPQAAVLNGATDKVLAAWLAEPDEPAANGGLAGRRLDTVVLDPPRSGAGRRAIERLIALAPERIVYVSCDPASFARDLGWLTKAGYLPERARVLDLYPDTHHLESVTLLTRGAIR